MGGNGAGSVVRCHREGRVRREARRLGAASENPSGLDGQAARSGCLDIAAPRTGCLIGGSYRFLGRKQVSGERVPGDDVGGGGGGETGLAARAGIGMRVTHTCTCTRVLKVDPPVSAATPRPFLLSRLRLHRATRPAGLLGLKAAPARHSGLWRSGGRLLGPPGRAAIWICAAGWATNKLAGRLVGGGASALQATIIGWGVGRSRVMIGQRSTASWARGMQPPVAAISSLVPATSLHLEKYGSWCVCCAAGVATRASTCSLARPPNTAMTHRARLLNDLIPSSIQSSDFLIPHCPSSHSVNHTLAVL